MPNLFYFAWISLLMCALLVYGSRQSRNENFPHTLFLQVSGILLVATPIGARALHVLYEALDFYLDNPLRVLFVWQGGFVYFGGLIAGMLAVIVYFQIRPREKNFWITADFFAPLLNLGTGLGRIACYIEGCCFGGPWPFTFIDWERHPTQLYLLFWEMLVFIFLSSIKPHLKRWQEGTHFLSWLLLSALGRFFVEYLRMDFRGALFLHHSISQWVALGIILISGVFLLQKNRFKLR